ncbi:hypothetical protein PanWU01x14_044590 [Parasponia andersonii]|uniref:Serine-rich protein-like protein n=1 Tax=Parasponia andersonii TaxID=3476 RepID=A0A2P5DP94_PARAD|nr:hypothetical protein PanWU01x14_044590 [Parasponia andersonii]
MPAETENTILKNNDSMAFILWLNKTRKTKSGEEDEVTKKVTEKENNPSEKKNVAQGKAGSNPRKACICSPTSHAGSFRCHLHRTNAGFSCREKKMMTNNNSNSTSFMNSKNVRTIGDGQPRLSRFGRAACENRPLTKAASKPEEVK